MMLKFWNNLTIDMKAIIGTVIVFILTYLITLMPVWFAATLFGLAFVLGVYGMMRAIFTLQSWNKEDKE